MHTRKVILTAGIAALVLGTGTAAYAESGSSAAVIQQAAKKTSPVTAGPAGLDVTVRTVTVPGNPAGNVSALATCPADHPGICQIK